MITVLVVDDQPLVRQAVRDILTDSGGILVVGEASNGREAVRRRGVGSRRRPDGHPDARARRDRGHRADLRGPRGRCNPGARPDDVRGGRVRRRSPAGGRERVHREGRRARGHRARGAHDSPGEALLSSAATQALVQRFVHRQAPRADAWEGERLARLTEREREVFLLVARGLTNQEIATELVISTHTAKTHVNRIMAKVHARDRAHLVILAYESGLVTARS